MESCIFCNLIKKKEEKILYEDDLMIIIPDIRPDARIHLLAITKNHIKDANHLTKLDLPLLEHIKDKTLTYLENNYSNEKAMYNFII
jgi:diadenosine tetraphosphate (Ap4A) HIT family hydrolase